jgi:hypothetical protein
VVVIILIVCLWVVAILSILTGQELKWTQAQLRWENERFVFIAEVFNAVNAVKHHKFTRGRRFGANGPGGFNVLVYEGVELPYQTLADMVELEHEQQELLVVAIDHLKLYELENPKPEPPTYFGHRLPDRSNQCRVFQKPTGTH